MNKVLELVERLEKEYKMAPVCPQVQSEVLTLTKIIRLQNYALDKIANKETCNELYPGFEKYNNFYQGWEGVSTYSFKILEETNRIAGGDL